MLGDGESKEATEMWDNLTPEQQDEFKHFYYLGQSDFAQAGNWSNSVEPTQEETTTDLMYLINLGREL